MINKDILVKNTQIFIYFNYSLKLVPRAKTSKEKKWREYKWREYKNTQTCKVQSTYKILVYLH